MSSDDPPPEEGEIHLDELLLDMKDTSELMVDLAYSAFLYQHRVIAEEVFELEDEVDARMTEIQRNALQLHRAGEIDIDHALAYLRLADAAEVIADSAVAISDSVLRDVEVHPIFRMSMRESDVLITRVVVQPGSPLDGATLGSERVATETGMRVIAIRRGTRWIYGPTHATEVKQGDVLVARGHEEGERALRRIVGLPEEPDEAVE